MGSVNVETEDELTVLITGFGPFKDQYPVNPSWEIARSLPAYLPPERAKTVPAPTAGTAAGDAPRVRLLVHPEPVRVNYGVVRTLVPTLWDGDGDDPEQSSSPPERAGKKVDVMLHIGMAGPEPIYQIERRGHRDGYRIKDVDGQFLDDEQRRADEGDAWIWHGVPDELLTDLDVEDIHRRWVARSPKDANIRISEDAGRYLCDFIYFSSLAHLWKARRPRRVLFLHVPADQSAATIRSGTELALQLIRSIVDSELAARRPAAGSKPGPAESGPSDL